MRYAQDFCPTWNARRKRAPRRGTATVEFAIIAPILVALMLGMVEVTRAIQVKEILTDTARSGCRLGAMPGTTTQSITSNVSTILSNNGISATNATITVQVNGSSTADAKTAVRGDKITVMVSVPISSVNWVTPLFISKLAVGSEAQHMVRQ